MRINLKLLSLLPFFIISTSLVYGAIPVIKGTTNLTFSDSTNKSQKENFENETFNVLRGEERIELYDLLQILIPDDKSNNILDWNTGLNESKIVWSEKYEVNESTWPDSEDEKYGKTDITIGGNSFFYRKKLEHPFTWVIILSGSDRGYDKFWINSGEEAHDYNTTLEYLFPGKDYEAALYRECEDFEIAKIYEITFPGKKKIWLRSEIELGVILRIICIFSDKYLPELSTCY